MKFSVVTICYNVEDEIEATMQSILNQTCSSEEYEYIVVDGASDDSTFDIVLSYRAKFREKGVRFRCYSAPDNGISDAFNKGIRYAEGEWVALVNAGDHYAADALETFGKSGMDDADICYGHISWINRETGLTYRRLSTLAPNCFALGMPVMHPACIIRKTAYEEVGLYKEEFRYSMDRELLARMQCAGKRFKCIDHVFSEMSVGGVSDTGAYSSQSKKESRAIALACGISPWHFECHHQYEKCRFYLTRLLRRCTWLHRFLMKSVLGR